MCYCSDLTRGIARGIPQFYLGFHAKLCNGEKNNQVSKTIKTPYGYHIFKVVDVKAARQMGFSESKKNIYERFSREKQSVEFEQWLLNLKNNSKIIINENVLSKFSL